MKKLLHLTIRIAVLVLLLVGLVSFVLADGTETLGTPSIPIASGSGIVAAGTGLQNAQPGTISIDVPAGATINQVLLYWAGAVTGDQNNPIPADSTVIVNDTEVAGTLIGGPAFFFSAFGLDFLYSNYRADITGFGLVEPGANTLTVEGLNNKDANGRGENSGAGILVIFDDGSGSADIQVRDGLDLSFFGFPEPRKTTIPQTFTFVPSNFERVANLIIFAGSVGAENRPNLVRVAIDGGPFIDHFNLLSSNDGDLWDTLTLPVTIPASASSMTVQVLSNSDGSGNTPSSLNWIGAGLSLPEFVGQGCTPGYWKGNKHLDSWVGYSPDDSYADVFGVLYDVSLLEALQAGGGGEVALGSHAVAALLNAAHPDVDYFYSEAQVITLVQDAYATGDFETAKDLFDAQNSDNTFCPLN